MTTQIIKKILLNRLERVLNYLYKDKPLITNLTIGLVSINFLIIIKLALIGFQQKLYSGYFEHMVIALLVSLVIIFVSILILQTSFKRSGWGGIALIFIGIAGVGLFFYDTTVLIPLAGKMIGFFAGGHLLYKVLFYIINNYRGIQNE